MISAKDILPTLVAAGAAYTGFLAMKGKTLPLAMSNRWAVLLLLILGLVACATGAQNVVGKSTMSVTLGVVGGLILLLAIVGLMKPSAGLVAILSGAVVLMWAVTTVRHAMS